MRKILFLICCLFLTACSKVVEEENRDIPLEISVEEGNEQENKEEITEEPVFSLSFFPEAEEGMAYLEKLGFEPFLFEQYLPVCQVGNGTVCYTGFTEDFPLWTGDVFLENDNTLEIFSHDLVYFYSESGEKYQLTGEGFVFLA